MSYTPPPLPQSKINPTQTGRQLRELGKMAKRMKEAVQQDVSRLVLQKLKARRYVILGNADGEDDTTTYDWRTTDQDELRDSLENALLVAIVLAGFGERMTDVMALVQSAYRESLARAISQVSKIDPVMYEWRTATTVMQDDAHGQALGILQSELVAQIKAEATKSAATAAAQALALLQAGLAPEAISSTVADPAAKKLPAAIEFVAATTLAQAARRAVSTLAQQHTGSVRQTMRLGMLWVSALLPTTRQWHGSRHGHTYTPQQVAEFYADPGNVRNCYCTQILVPVDEAGNMPDNGKVKALMSRMRAQRDAWNGYKESKK